MTRAFALIVLTLALLPGCHREPADLLTDEFRGSYPTQVREVGSVREYELSAAPAVLPMFDGRPLQVWAYNGQVPGPILHATVGERLRVRFTNRLPIDTTVHWHGVRVPNAMDGAPGLT